MVTVGAAEWGLPCVPMVPTHLDSGDEVQLAEKWSVAEGKEVLASPTSSASLELLTALMVGGPALDNEDFGDETAGGVPLHFACGSGKAEDVAFLVGVACSFHGESCSTISEKSLNSKDAAGNTPLMSLVVAGSAVWSLNDFAAIVELLVTQGADPLVQRGDGYTVLTLALQRREYAFVRVLMDPKGPIALTDGLKTLATRPTAKGNTPLHIASAGGAPAPAARLLLDTIPRGAVSRANAAGQTPLHLAAVHAPYLVDLLVRRGARVDAVDGGGATPVFKAAAAGRAVSVAALVLHNADVRTPNAAGVSAYDVSKKTPEVRAILREATSGPPAKKSIFGSLFCTRA
ncbi:Tankyrase [Diplonema papillatum]|nr:Tankyrase [Diplonema papillatum]